MLRAFLACLGLLLNLISVCPVHASKALKSAASDGRFRRGGVRQ